MFLLQAKFHALFVFSVALGDFCSIASTKRVTAFVLQVISTPSMGVYSEHA